MIDKKLLQKHLESILAAAGFLLEGRPAEGLVFGQAAQAGRRGRAFLPDARWRGGTGLSVYFKSLPEPPSEETVSRWRQELWNEGYAPLLWVVTPARVDLYNGYGQPLPRLDARRHCLRSFAGEGGLDELGLVAGRLAMETGQVWYNLPGVDRVSAVDQQFLRDLNLLDERLTHGGLAGQTAGALIARLVFCLYLIGRGHLSARALSGICGHDSLAGLFQDPAAPRQLFAWLARTFHGHLLPEAEPAAEPSRAQCQLVSDFLQGRIGETGVFPYQFNVMPIAFFADAGERFMRARESRRSSTWGSRRPLAQAAIARASQGLTGRETLLDLTCGTGAFLASGLARFMALRSAREAPSRALLRQLLSDQLTGMDCNPQALSVAAYSLYLTALELDPEPDAPGALTLPPLLGSVLLLANLREQPRTSKRHDLIVGNPPWHLQPLGQGAGAMDRRGTGLGFLDLALDFSHEHTRFALVMSSACFCETPGQPPPAWLRRIMPIRLVNLATQRGWLYATRYHPATLLLARRQPGSAPAEVAVARTPRIFGGRQLQALDLQEEDTLTLPQSELLAKPWLLTGALVGQQPDLDLLAALGQRHPSLERILARHGARLQHGLPPDRALELAREKLAQPASTSPESDGYEYLRPVDFKGAAIPKAISNRFRLRLPAKSLDAKYRAPLVILKPPKSNSNQLQVAVAERSLVYGADLTGISLSATALGREALDICWLLTAILSSSLTTWFAWLMASGVLPHRRVSMRYLERLPMPDLEEALASVHGQRAAQQMQARSRSGRLDLPRLDEAVFSLYGLADHERLVVMDGSQRSVSRWDTGQQYAATPTSSRGEVLAYAYTLCAELERLLPTGKERPWVRTEVLDLPINAPLRQVRCELARDPRQAGAFVKALGPADAPAPAGLPASLAQARRLLGPGRELAVITKRPLRHYWLDVCALEDARALVKAGFAQP